MVKNDINAMLSNMYNGTEQKVDTKKIEDNLNENIEKSGIKNGQNEGAIKQFVEHICDEYTNTLIHTKYETKINEMYIKIVENLNELYRITLTICVLDIIAIIMINKKKISKDIQYFGIALLATSFFDLSVWQIVMTKIDINGIKIFNDAFSKSLVNIIQEYIYQIASLALGTMVIGIIFISIYVTRVIMKASKNKDEKNKTKEI